MKIYHMITDLQFSPKETQLSKVVFLLKKSLAGWPEPKRSLITQKGKWTLNAVCVRKYNAISLAF